MTSARSRLPVFAGCLLLSVAFARAAEPSRQQRLAALPDDERVWLTNFVAPIILPEEERVFLQLTDTAQREGFKEDFWQRREKPGLPLPLGPGYRDRYRGVRQIIDGKDIGWESDAGRLILRRGEPDSIFKPRCAGEEVFRDLEVWTYSGLELNGHPATRHIFYRRAPGAPRKLWMIHDGNIVFQPGACRTSFDQLSRDCRPSREDRCGRCEDRCVVYGAWAEILKRQGGPAGALAEQGALFNYPKIPTDGLDRSKAKWAAVAPAASAARPAAPAPTAPAPTPTAVPPPPPPPPTSAASPIPTPRPAPLATATPAPVRLASPTAAAPVPRAVTAPVWTPPPAPPTPRPTSSPTGTPTPVSPTPRPTATPPASTPAPTRSPSPRQTAAPTRVPTLTPPPKPSGPSPTPYPAGQGLRRLSATEIQERMKTLEPQDLEFLDLAKPFMTEEDVSRFLQLSDHDKESFIRDFWKRHS